MGPTFQIIKKNYGSHLEMIKKIKNNNLATGYTYTELGFSTSIELPQKKTKKKKSVYIMHTKHASHKKIKIKNNQ